MGRFAASLAIVAPACLLAAACGFDGLGSAGGGTAPGADASTSDGAHLPEAAPPSDSSASDAGGGDAEAGSLPSIQLLAPDTTLTTSDLTTEGTLDWAHWGSFDGEVRRKATGGNLIGDYVKTATGGNVYDYDYVGWPLAVSWTDGPATDMVATDRRTHRYFVYATDVAVTFELPAVTTERTAVFFVGGYAARGRLEAWLDDAPATIVSDERESQVSYHRQRYEVRYRGGPSTTKLVARLKMVTRYVSNGTIIVQSVALR